MTPVSSVRVPSILVTDPEQRAALATVRSLGRRGWHVETVGASRGLAGVSRHVARHHAVDASHVAAPDAYRDAVRQAVQRSGCHVVVPITDTTSRTLLGYGEMIGAPLAGPSAEAYARASDKQTLQDAAARLGIRVPQQVVLDTPGTSVSVPFPSCVVKPARSVVEVQGRTQRVGVRYCADPAELRTVTARYPAEAYPLLLQERIHGDGRGVFLLRSNGETRACFGHRRLREKPPSGGVSTYREAWAPPATLVGRCEALLDAIAFEGAAMVEFKEEHASGELVLMEVNARLWGSVQLAVDAGIDFPAALVELALGLPSVPAVGAAAGVRSVWELGELDHALTLARHSAASLDLPPGTRTGWRAAVGALLDHRVGDRLEVFRPSDPMPFAAELWRWVRRR